MNAKQFGCDRRDRTPRIVQGAVQLLTSDPRPTRGQRGNGSIPILFDKSIFRKPSCEWILPFVDRVSTGSGSNLVNAGSGDLHEPLLADHGPGAAAPRN